MSTELKRCLSLWEIVIYGVGLILGAGIYVLIGAAAGIAGNMLWLSFLLAAIVASFTAVSYAELSTMFPKSGAEFLYVKAASGSDALAWIIGFCAIVIGLSTASAVAVGFAGYFIHFFPTNPIWVAVSLILLMSLVSFWGIKQSTRFNILATSIEVEGLVLIILVGLYQLFFGSAHFAELLSYPISSEGTLLNSFPLVSAAALIFFAFLGFEDIANIAEEAEKPEKILPKAYIYSLLISSIIYILIAIVVVSIIPYQSLAESKQPLALVTEQLIGESASSVMALIALFATANTVLISLIVCTRMTYGIEKEKALPKILAKIHPTRQTPWAAIIIVCFLSLSFLAFKEIEILASISDVGIFVLFFSVNLSNIVLRFRQPHIERPWRAPLNIGRLPIISLLGTISCLLMLFAINHPVLIFGKESSSLIVGLIIFALAIPLYFIIGRKRK